MKGFANLFAFSFSSWKTFRRCPRAWWISKVQFWGGWNRSEVAPSVRLAYGLTKMQTAYTLAGSIVHSLAEEVVRNPVGRTTEQLLTAFEIRFAAGVQQSLRGDWKQDPKRAVNLFEHYYGDPGGDRNLERAKGSGLRAMMHILDSGVTSRARRGRVIQTEVLEQFRILGIPVWVQIDLAVEADDLVYLDDYKTGRRRPEHRLQSLLYALFWVDVRGDRGVGLDRIRLSVDYLRDQEEDLFAPTEDDLDELRAVIVEAAAELRERLTPPADGSPWLNVGREADFPGVEDPTVCADCALFHACKGTRKIPFAAVRGEVAHA